MDDWFASEEFARAPVARVMAEIWRQGLSGSLYVQAGGGPKCLSFERGALVLDSVSFEEKDFLRFLLTTGETDLIALARVEEHAQRTEGSMLRSFIETSVFGPERLWTLLQTYAREEALALCENAGAGREFHTRSGPPVRVYVDRGRVILAGTVGSAVEQVAAGMLARGTLAFTVNNQVKVEGDRVREEERKKDPNET
jgi:hypothetical protein